MKKMASVVSALLLIFAAALTAAGGDFLRIVDATGGAPMQAVRLAALRAGMQKSFQDCEISIEALPYSTALKRFQDNAVDVLFIDHSQLPAALRSKCRLWAAEALVFYTSLDNPVRNLSTAQAREIWEREQPVWNWFGGSDLNVQRIGVTLNVSGNLERRFLGESRFNKGIFRVTTFSQAVLHLNPAVLIAAPYRLDLAADIRMLSVNNIPPSAGSVSSGKYPFSCRYAILTGKGKNRYVSEFLSLIKSGTVYRELNDSGLLYLGYSKEPDHEKRP